MTDEELIAEGRKYARTVERAQLTLGRLALEYAPIGDPAVKTGVYTRLEEYADAIGADAGTLRNYRAVAHAWRDIHVGDHGFSVLKALTSVAYKQPLLDALAATAPDTKSGRWTAPAAVDFAKENGYWSHDGTPHTTTTLNVLQRMRSMVGSLGRAVRRDEFSPEEIADAVSLLTEIQLELSALRNQLSPLPAKSRRR